MTEPKVAIPDNAVVDVPVGEASTVDLLPPLKGLLTGLDVLGGGETNNPKPNGGVFRDPDPANAIIETTATKLRKGWAVVVAAAGGGSGLVAWIANFWNSQHEGVRIALIAAGARSTRSDGDWPRRHSELRCASSSSWGCRRLRGQRRGRSGVSEGL